MQCRASVNLPAVVMVLAVYAKPILTDSTSLQPRWRNSRIRSDKKMS